MIDSNGVCFTVEKNGHVTAVLAVDGKKASWLTIVPMQIRIGAATVRMDGIAGVGTDDDCRYKGYSRRVMEASVRYMMAGESALSMLYGIWDYYPRFGYAFAGADHLSFLTDLKRVIPLPDGWTIRSLVVTDIPSIRAIYDRNTANTVGAKIRPENDRTWERLSRVAAGTRDKDACRVLVNNAGALVAYAWRSAGHWYVDKFVEEYPEAFVFGEVEADESVAAEAVLEMCRQWTIEASVECETPYKSALIAVPPAHPVARAAMFHASHQVRRFAPAGDSMARVLNVNRLLTSLAPELTVRAQNAGLPPIALRVDTEIGGATLAIDAGGAKVVDTAANAMYVTLQQDELARLALGAYEPADLIARTPERPSVQETALIAALFPHRQPHMNVPDRF